MVTATEWLKKAESNRSKNPDKFKPVRRRAWDYVDNLAQESSIPPVENKEIIWEQKQEQIGNKDNINSERNWEQNRNENNNIQEQKQEQTENKYGNQYRNNNRIKSIPTPQNNTAAHANALLDDNTAQKRLLTLSGYQKQIMKHVTSHFKSRVGESYIVDVLPNILAMKINAGLEVTRVTLKRLAGKNLLIKLAGERGRNGCCKFTIQENILKICFSLFNDVPCDINYINNEIGNTNRNNPSLSSSSEIKTTTTDMPNDWKLIDTSPLNQNGIHFTKNEIKNIFNKGSDLITHAVVQDSINQFAFGMQHNPERYKSMKSPTAILVSHLSQGIAWVESGYVSPEEKLRAEKENKATKFFEQQFKEPKFLSWFHALTDDEKENLVPDGFKSSASYTISKMVIQKEEAFKKFEHAIWPVILKQLKENLE